MSKIKFKEMRIKFSTLLDLLNDYNENDFGSLVFQPEVEEPFAGKDKIILIAYRVSKDGRNFHPVGLETGDLKDPKNKNKLKLANLPLSRKRIESMKTNYPPGTVKYLQFSPKEYADKDYVCYEIKPLGEGYNIMSATFNDYDPGNLNPSPPADPQ